MANKFTAVLAGQDDLTPVVNEAGKSLDRLGKGMKDQVGLTEKMTGVIREERQEGRLRNFALRESAGAVQQLSDVFVGPSGLGKAVQGGVSSLFEFDFAMKSVSAVGKDAPGWIGKIAGGLGSIALPASLALGAFALIKSALDEEAEAMKKNLVELTKLDEQLGKTPVDKVKELQKELAKLRQDAQDSAPLDWGNLWRGTLDNVLGTHLAINHAMAVGVELATKEQAIAVKGLEVTKETLTANESILGAQLKLLEIEVKKNEGEVGGLELQTKKAGLAKDTVSALEREYEFAKTTNLERETAIEKQARLLAIEVKLSEARRVSAEQGRLVANIGNGPEAMTTSLSIGPRTEVAGKGRTPLQQMIDIDNLIKAKKIYSGIEEQAKGSKRILDTTMDETLKGLQNEFKGFNEWITGPLNSGVDALSQGLLEGMGGAFESVFGEANSLLEKFVQGVINGMIEVSTRALAKKAVGGFFSLLSFIPGFGAIGSFLGFHEGGEVPRAHEGAFVNAPPSKEFPILVRGGETIRTEDQESRLQRVVTAGIGAIAQVRKSSDQGVPGVRETLYDGLDAISRTKQTPDAELGRVPREAGIDLMTRGSETSPVSRALANPELAQVSRERGSIPRAHEGAYVLERGFGGSPVISTAPVRSQNRESATPVSPTVRPNMSVPQGTTIHLNMNGTAIGGAKFVRDALSELRRQTGLGIDELTQDRSGQVLIRG